MSNSTGNVVIGVSRICQKLVSIAYQLARKCKSYADALCNAENFDAVYHGIPTQLKHLLVGPLHRDANLPLLYYYDLMFSHPSYDPLN